MALKAETKSSFTPGAPTGAANYDYMLKLVIIGDSGVGKSCLLLRFVDDKFEHSRQGTIGVDFRFRTLNIDGVAVKLQVWDTAGQERFRTIRSAYYRGADGLIVVYDITKKESFERIQMWIDEAYKYSNEKPQKLLIGTKSDLVSSRAISFEAGKAMADKLEMRFFETSAMQGSNVVDAFTALTKVLLAQKKATMATQPAASSGVDITPDADESFLSKIPCCNNQ